MKKVLIFIGFFSFLLMGCSIFRGGEKYGCPTNGKNIGAERLVSGDPAAVKAAKKAGKFRN